MLRLMRMHPYTIAETDPREGKQVLREAVGRLVRGEVFLVHAYIDHALAELIAFRALSDDVATACKDPRLREAREYWSRRRFPERVDVARMMRFITENTKQRLLELNRVRNMLAHPPGSLDAKKDQAVKYRKKSVFTIAGPTTAMDDLFHMHTILTGVTVSPDPEQSCEFMMKMGPGTGGQGTATGRRTGSTPTEAGPECRHHTRRYDASSRKRPGSP